MLGMLHGPSEGMGFGQVALAGVPATFGSSLLLTFYLKDDEK